MAKRKGRPRAEGRREPNGRLQRPGKTERGHYWQRELDVLREGSVDWRLTTPLGVMFRRDLISNRMLDVGVRFAELREAADAALGLPPRIPAAQDLSAFRGHPGDVDEEGAARKRARDIKAYDDACIAVGMGSAQLAALELIAVYQRRADHYQQVLDCIEALHRLMRHFGERA